MIEEENATRISYLKRHAENTMRFLQSKNPPSPHKTGKYDASFTRISPQSHRTERRRAPHAYNENLSPSSKLASYETARKKLKYSTSLGRLTGPLNLSSTQIHPQKKSSQIKMTSNNFGSTIAPIDISDINLERTLQVNDSDFAENDR